MPSYSNIFQPETSFRTQIVDLENEDKKNCPIDCAFSLLFASGCIELDDKRITGEASHCGQGPPYFGKQIFDMWRQSHTFEFQCRMMMDSSFHIRHFKTQLIESYSFLPLILHFHLADI